MRLLLVVCLVGCADWNRSPTQEDLVDRFVEAEGLADAQDCGQIDTVTCDSGEEEPFADAIVCLADAFATCTPARLAITSANGDGVETYEVFVVHPEGEECAVQRFVDAPEGGRRVLAEEHCQDLSVAEDDVCTAPEAAVCDAVCGGDAAECAG